jgi:outer membrane protein OmpA-like peptidoglycan-associated protein
MQEHITTSQGEQVIPAADTKPLITKTALNRQGIQRKLSVGAVNDPMEQEADAVADQVMRMPDTMVQRKCSYCEEEEQVQRKPLATFIQRKCAHCEEEEKARLKPLDSFIQKKGNEGGGTAGEAVSQQINASRGNGSTMDAPVKSFMESRFGTDFSGVKIHTGSDAVQLSRELNAQAFTVGSDIYFNEGKYSPGSDSGKHLLAHELTHTVQQGGNGIIQKKPATVTGEDVAEDTEDGVTYVVKRDRVATTKTKYPSPSFSADIDKKNVSITLKVCRGKTRVDTTLGANIPEAAQDTAQKVVEAVVSGGDVEGILRNAAAKPFIEMVIAQSGSMKLTARGEITVSSKGVTGGGGSLGVDFDGGRFDISGQGDDKGWSVTGNLKIPLGSKPEKFDCKTTSVEFRTTYTCQQKNPDRVAEKTRTVPLTDTLNKTVYFNHAQHNADIDKNKIVFAEVQALLGQGYRLTQIQGFTSPEGPVGSRKGRSFEGNQILAQERADAVLKKITKMCAKEDTACATDAITSVMPLGKGELYSLPDDKDGLDSEAYMATELKDDAQKEAFGKLTPLQQEQMAYPLLRRTIVVLEKKTTAIEKYSETTSVPNSDVACPAAVIEAAGEAFR